MQKLRGIVLHSLKYGESSLIVRLYTDVYGRQTYMLRGVRKTTAQHKAACVQPLFLLALETYPARKAGGMGIIKEMKTLVPLPNMTSDVRKTAMALFISEVLHRFVKEEEPNPALYDFLQQHIIALEQIEQEMANFHLFFLAQLAQHLGFLPGNTYDARLRCFFDIQAGQFVGTTPLHTQYFSPQNAALLWQLLQSQISDLQYIKLHHQQRQTLLNGLLDYYSFHLGMQNPIRSLAVLHEVFQ
ncbi:DNA repair protein RecO [Bacteroidia bacterium]|nr:DNA repair protein RecO [Bacteroidia bacterium]